MRTFSIPESRALFFVFAIVISSVAMQLIFLTLVHIEAAEERARVALENADEVDKKIEELRNEIETSR
jgi:hypothetical protein